MENNNLNKNEFMPEVAGEPALSEPTFCENADNTSTVQPPVEQVTETSDEVNEYSETAESLTQPDNAAEYEYQPSPDVSEQDLNNNNGFSSPQAQSETKYYGGDIYSAPQQLNNVVQGYTLPKQLEDDPSNKKGMRVFALVLIAVILSVSVFTGGYFLGRGNGVAWRNIATPGIESKADADQVNIAEVFENVINSVVQIKTYNSQAVSTASGVIYTEDGYIITNDHIYSKITSPEFLVTLYDGTEYKAQYIAGDTRSDLAVLKIDAKGLPTAAFGSSEELVVGEQVAAIGYPNTSSNGIASLTSGIVSSLGARVSTTTSYSTKFIQTDTAINPGSSGGVLVNMYSQIVGITSAKIVSEDCEGVGYAIPSVSAKKIVDLLIKEGYVKGRAKLGITYTEVDSVYSNVSEMPRGLYVASVSDDSPVAEIGLKQGDIITHVNDNAITNSSVMLDVIESASAGDTIAITVYDTTTEQTFTYQVVLAEDAGSSSYSSSPKVEADDGGSESNEDEREYFDEFDFPAGE